MKSKNRKKKISTKTKVIVLLIFIISAILSVIYITKPRYINKTLETNVLTQKTSYEYKVKSLPNGLQEFDGKIFPKVQGKVNIIIKSQLTSQNEVDISGEYYIILKLIAEGLWEKNMVLTRTKKFEDSGTDIIILNEEIVIDLNKILNEIEVIGTDILGIRPGTYRLEVKPVIEGFALYNDSTISLESDNQIVYFLDSMQVRLDEEQSMTYDKITPIEKTVSEEQFVNIIGYGVSLIVIRYIWCSLFLISTVLLIIIISRKRHDKQYKSKYENRMIVIQNNVDYSGFAVIPITPLKSLVRIADEKNQFILKYINKINKSIHYYVICDNHIYLHEILFKCIDNI